MKQLVSGSLCAAFVGALSIVAFAQATEQQAPAPQTQTGGQPAASPARPSGDQQQLTVVGCIQREADYRKAKDAGKGGVAGTGVGAGNEFVLINAAAAPGAAPAPTGTSGRAGAIESAYELTGSGEGQAEKFVGKRVEIMGRVKPAETTASGAATGGPTAGAPPKGVDAISADLKLRELEVVSVKESSGNCPS